MCLYVLQHPLPPTPGSNENLINVSLVVNDAGLDLDSVTSFKSWEVRALIPQGCFNITCEKAVNTYHTISSIQDQLHFCL